MGIVSLVLDMEARESPRSCVQVSGEGIQVLGYLVYQQRLSWVVSGAWGQAEPVNLLSDAIWGG